MSDPLWEVAELLFAGGGHDIGTVRRAEIEDRTAAFCARIISDSA